MKLSTLAFPVILAQVLSSYASSLPRHAQPLLRRAGGDGTIPALLRKPHGPRSQSGLISRQDTCDIGYFPCSDGKGCCPDDEYCGVWSGKPGCCPNGESCVANSDPCIYQGDVLCPNDTFCCPAGETCSRDVSGAPLCSNGGSGPPTLTNPLTNTFTNTPTKATSNTLVPLSATTSVVQNTVGPATTGLPLTTQAPTVFPNGGTSAADVLPSGVNGKPNGASANMGSFSTLVLVGVGALNFIMNA